MALPTYFPPRSTKLPGKRDPEKAPPRRKAENSGVRPAGSGFIEGYDNAVVQSNIHYPADAQPVKSPRNASNAAMQAFSFEAIASQRSFNLSAIPETPLMTANTERIYQRAVGGQQPEIKALADWASIHEAETGQLRQRLRRQQHDFASLFEMVSATSARAMDLLALQTYMLRTVAGHLATSRVMIVRRTQSESLGFFSVASQGLKGAQLRLGADSFLCRYAFETGGSFALEDLPGGLEKLPELGALRTLGMHTVVPLLQEVDRTGAVLEGFLFIGPKLTGRPYMRSEIEFLDVLCKMFAICLRNENLYRRSTVDTLTGVSSRGHFDAQLSQQLLHAAAEKKSLGLIMLDVDHFKAFNDQHGHQTGDRVLKALARVLVEQVRNVDLIARYGGEEFAIVCVEIEKNVAREVADRLRAAISQMEIAAPDGSKLHITASLGVSCFPEDAADMASLVQAADVALYRSKDAGRNRVTMADTTQKKRGSKIRRINSLSGEWKPGDPPLTAELARRKHEQAAKHSDSRQMERRGKSGLHRTT